MSDPMEEVVAPAAVERAMVVFEQSIILELVQARKKSVPGFKYDRASTTWVPDKK